MRSLNAILFVAVVSVLLVVLPVSACHADATKSGPSDTCTGSDMTYTITATTRDANNLYVKVVDYLPSGVTYISSSPAGTYNANDNTVTWIYHQPTKNTPRTMTLTVRPNTASSTPIVNSVKTWISYSSSPYSWTSKLSFLNLVTTKVSSCQAEVEITGDSSICDTCTATTYNIDFSYNGLPNYYGKVVYTLPAGASYLSSSPAGVYDSGSGTVTWEFGPMGATETKTFSVTINPQGGASPLVNTVDAFIRPSASAPWSATGTGSVVWNTQSQPCVPEFPSIFLPATMIVGSLGLILCIRRIR